MKITREQAEAVDRSGMNYAWIMEDGLPAILVGPDDENFFRAMGVWPDGNTFPLHTAELPPVKTYRLTALSNLDHFGYHRRGWKRVSIGDLWAAAKGPTGDAPSEKS